MTKYFVIVSPDGDSGLRTYNVYAPSPIGALFLAVRADYNDYPCNPAPFDAFEIIEGGRIALSQ